MTNKTNPATGLSPVAGIGETRLNLNIAQPACRCKEKCMQEVGQ